jgi:ankyrin repeat protein
MGEPEAFHKACRIGNAAEIQALVQEKPELVSMLDADLGWSALYRAVMCGHFDAVQVLLSYGANPSLCNRLGETPLHQAVCSSLALTQLLLEHGADPNIQQQDGDTPLHVAAFRGDVEATQLLLSYGAKVDIKNYLVSPRKFGKTALHYATEGDFLPVVEALLEAGASADVRDKVKSELERTQADRGHNF